MAHLNYGTFSGIIGGNLELIMKLDLGIQLTSVLLNAKVATKENAFEAWLKSSSVATQHKEALLHKLIQWMILNYSGNKTKTSPSGSRIFSLSQNVEQLLNKVSASEEAVAKCLPILMRTILQADFKLRELISKSGQQAGGKDVSYLINYERAL